MAHIPSIRPYSTETVVSSTWFFHFPTLIFLSFGIYTSYHIHFGFISLENNAEFLRGTLGLNIFLKVQGSQINH